MLTKSVVYILAFCFLSCSCIADVVQESKVSYDLTSNKAAIYDFHLPLQSLAQSLADISRVANESIVYDPLQIQMLIAEPIDEKTTVHLALQKLLKDKPFTVEPVAQSSAAPLTTNSWSNQQAWVIKKTSSLQVVESSVSAYDNKPIEEVVVTGYYANNLSEALKQKKEKAEIAEVIVAQDIENFPAQNIAEALQHSSGITVVRDRGEALFVSVRGLPTNFNRVTLNGSSLAANENVRNSGQYGRRFHFDTFPAELVESVEVIKASDSAQDEGAIGGIVNIKTFSPFALAKSQLSLSTSLDESELAGNTKPRFSGLLNWVNDKNNLGFSIAASFARRSLRQDRALNFGWSKLAPGENTTDATQVITPSSFRPTLELEDRLRRGLTATVEWKPSEELNIAWHALSLNQKIHYSEFSYGAGYAVNELLDSKTQFRNNALIGGETTTGSVQISRESSGVVDSNYSQDLDFNWQHEQWNYTLKISDSRAHSYNNDPIKRIRLHREGDVNLTFYYPRINGSLIPNLYINNINLLNPSDFYGRRMEWRIIDSQDKEQSIHMNAQYAIDANGLESIETGFKVSQHQRNYYRKDQIIGDGIAGTYFPKEFFEPFPIEDFLSKTNLQLPSKWLVPNQRIFWNLVNEQSFYNSAPTQGDLLNSYNIDEKTQAYFLKLNLANTMGLRDWTGNVGVRWVRTRQVANGFSFYNDLASPQEYGSSYQHALFSANSVLHLSENLYWRAAASSVMTRPDFQDLAPRLTLNSGESLTAVGGNPYLKPVTGSQFDSVLEWYFEEGGLLSTGIFFKKLDGFFQNQLSNIPINGKNYLVSSIGNGATAQVKGMEFSYQRKLENLPSPLNSLGIETNYTYTDSVANYYSFAGTIRDRLADVAKHSVNLGGYYESDALTIRLAYSWRDKVLNEVGTASTSALNTAAFGSLDGHIAYRLCEGLSLNIDAINMTNAAQQDYVADQEFAGYTLYGRRFLLGLKWRVF